MILLPYSRPWEQQPDAQTATRSDWVRLYTPTASGQHARISGPAIEPSAAGSGYKIASAGAFNQNEIVPGISSGITVVLIAQKVAKISEVSDFLFGEHETSVGGYNWGFYESVSSGSMNWFVHNGSSAASCASTQWTTTAGPQIWVGTFGDGDPNVRLYLNGGLASSTALTGSVRRLATAYLRTCQWQNGTPNFVMLAAAVAARRFPAEEVREKFASLGSAWHAMFEPQRIWVPVSAGGGASVGLSTETDAALSLATKQIAATGMAAESDAAQQLLAVSLAAVGLAAESDAALALSAMQLQAVGRADESDVALALSAGASAPVGIALGADAALALPALQIAGTGAALETDAALALVPNAPGSVGVALEADTALALAAVQSRPVGMATDTEAALALAAVQAITAGMALEIDAGLPLTGSQLRTVGRADEIDAALSLSAGSAGGTASAADVWSYVLSNGLTAEETVVQTHSMLTALTAAMATCPADLTLALKLLRNKQITNQATGKMTVYDDDGSTVLVEGNLFEDAAGTQPYRGQGAERRDRLT